MGTIFILMCVYQLINLTWPFRELNPIRVKASQPRKCVYLSDWGVYSYYNSAHTHAHRNTRVWYQFMRYNLRTSLYDNVSEIPHLGSFRQPWNPGSEHLHGHTETEMRLIEVQPTDMLTKKEREGVCECMRCAEKVWGEQRLGLNLLELKADRGNLFVPQYTILQHCFWNSGLSHSSVVTLCL